jgi:arginyl-tRNA--protein-N-Asp/Glu arginylyltransferase
MNKTLIHPLYHFYRTSSQPCPYLDGRTERKIITELTPQGGTTTLYNDLSRAGFRRSHQLAYRPACPSCDSCRPVRIDAELFTPGRSDRRLAQTNADLHIFEVEPIASVEQYRLFMRYQYARHGDSDMAGMSFGDYRAMIEDSPVDTLLVVLRDSAGRLMGVCLTDELDDGASAVYSFYDPDEKRRSLGTWLVLALIERVRYLRQRYVYLGYWIEESRKMGYKARFRPLEALGPDGWAPIEVKAGDQIGRR